MNTITDIHVDSGGAAAAGTQEIALALSGGGVRAMAFHAGVLRYLAERGMMERVCRVSSVSGGSLLAGLLFSQAGMKWPSSAQYLSTIRPAVRDLLVNKDLASASHRRLLWPSNWRYLFQRAKIMGQTIREVWNINETLRQLPARPAWDLNGTTAETGRRFQFKLNEFGDYRTGYAHVPDYLLADAMSSSAAFPGAIGPMPLITASYQWKQRKSKDAAADSGEPVKMPAKLHIYDGGVYDNLGMEPLFDMGRSKPRGPYRVIICDAGAPFAEDLNYDPGLNFSSVNRLVGIMMNQTHSLRVRAFINYLRHGGGGAYISIDAQTQQIQKDRQITPDPAIAWLSPENIDKATNYATTLNAMTVEDFDLIETQGYQSAVANEAAYPYLA